MNLAFKDAGLATIEIHRTYSRIQQHFCACHARGVRARSVRAMLAALSKHAFWIRSLPHFGRINPD
ncbi:hypothetical protein A6X21_16200 [Planctopirus hydrillae]|uniref:Uncharacterized protein n=1 Tax=Planctopirus hydrillae TaxID=1841610 RepID=A0A1C3ET23_9PLAN|nr:hypothetical protein A6X21_16200 [Planctopirus hydrillae]